MRFGRRSRPGPLNNKAGSLLPRSGLMGGHLAPSGKKGGQEYMLEAAALALRDILSPPFRNVLWKSLALTIGLLAVLWIVLEGLLAYLVALPYGWLDTAFSILRSEEHTSELQSRLHLVCRLLLEKKKKHN